MIKIINKNDVKAIFNFIGFQAVTFIVSWIIYLILINSKIFNFIDIYFYKSIVVLIVTCIVMLIVEIFIKYIRKDICDYKDIILSITIIMCINMVCLSSAVVSLDRSLSVFMLSYMAKEDRTYTEQEIERIFQETFVEKYGMLDRRFWEQLESGNIEKVPGGGYELTDRGVWFTKVFKIVGKLYNVDDRFINPQ